MRLAWVICLAVLTVADLRAEQDTKKRDDRPVISVVGCVDGSWLDVRRTDAVGSYATRYKLRGPKQLMKELEKWNRRVVDVTGRVVGAKDVPVAPSGETPSLEVEGFQEAS